MNIYNASTLLLMLYEKAISLYLLTCLTSQCLHGILGSM